MSKKLVEFDTVLGAMIAVSSDEELHLLDFADRVGIEKRIERLESKQSKSIAKGNTKLNDMIKRELDAYFSGELREFKTPFHLGGSEFQKRAWLLLAKIPYGQTRSYLEQATEVGNNKAFRAVANANGANQLAIIVPCHRIINHNGNLGGYGGGIERKKWLINHERKYA